MDETLRIAKGLIDNQIPKDKIVIGKCNQGCDPSYYIDGDTLLDATHGNYRGIMLWEWDNTNPQTSAESWLNPCSIALDTYCGSEAIVSECRACEGQHQEKLRQAGCSSTRVATYCDAT